MLDLTMDFSPERTQGTAVKYYQVLLDLKFEI